MNLRSSKCLGLAVRDGSILAAEVSVQAKGREVRHAAEFVIPDGSAWESPEQIGTALKGFLRQQGFSAGHAVVGVPTRWLMAVEKEVPPTSAQMAAAALRLQAERHFSPELKDLVFDYAGQTSSSSASRVLLLAMQQQQIDRISKMAQAAGLSLAGMGPSALALAGALGEAVRETMVLALDDHAADLVVLRDGTPRMLKYLAAPAGSAVEAIGGELRRTVWLASQGNGNGGAESLFLWDGSGSSSSSSTELSSRLGVPVRVGRDLGMLGTNGMTDRVSARFGAAVALGLAGAGAGEMGVDFLHSRLALPRVRKIGRRGVLGAVAGLSVVLALVLLGVDVQQQQSRLDELKSQFAQLGPRVQRADEVAKRVKYARGWFEQRPPMLQSLRELTLAFPEYGEVWATSFSVRENRTVVLAGKAVDQRSVLAVLDRLKGNPKLGDVKLIEVHEAGIGRREVSFSLNFTYKSLE